jgi:hypothetical protein
MTIKPFGPFPGANGKVVPPVWIQIVLSFQFPSAILVKVGTLGGKDAAIPAVYSPQRLREFI